MCNQLRGAYVYDYKDHWIVSFKGKEDAATKLYPAKKRL